MFKNRVTWLVVLLVLVLVAVTVLPAAANDPDAALKKVKIEDFRFRPRLTSAVIGDSIGWKNFGAAPHTTTSTTGVWDSGNMGTGDVFMWTPTAPGTYDYFCVIHPAMTGRIVVAADGG